MKNNLTHGSLFSGVGGFELGAQMSNIPTLWNCEILEKNRQILKKHFPKTIQYDDIKTLQKPTYCDIISGGFPCQDISIAGKGEGIKGERSGLWKEMFNVVRSVRPKYVIIENSPALLIRGFEQILCDFSEIGYVCEWQCIQAAQFGYNHKRERFFAIAYTMQERCEIHTQAFRPIQEIPIKEPSRESPLLVPFKRFDSHSNYADVRMDDGFSKELDVFRIEAMGNAVVPQIAHYLFECIKQHNEIYYK